MLVVAVSVAVLSTLAGTLAAGALHRETGPMIITAAGAIFLASLLPVRRTQPAE
jgi:ABC-type Mn2+/Zn2+ transport system permease subunit